MALFGKIILGFVVGVLVRGREEIPTRETFTFAPRSILRGKVKPKLEGGVI